MYECFEVGAMVEVVRHDRTDRGAEPFIGRVGMVTYNDDLLTSESRIQRQQQEGIWFVHVKFDDQDRDVSLRLRDLKRADTPGKERYTARYITYDRARPTDKRIPIYAADEHEALAIAEKSVIDGTLRNVRQIRIMKGGE